MNVYGFRCYPPRAQQVNHAFSGVAIAIPALDLLMRQDNGLVTDRTSYGNNGVCSGCVGARGVFDEGQKFDGVNDTINCGSNPSLDIAQDISASCWVKMLVQMALSILMIKTNGVLGWYMGLNAAGRPQIFFYNGGATVGGGGGTDQTTGRWAHLGFAVAGTVARLFVDGLEFARGAVVMSDSGVSSLYIASAAGGGNFLTGLVELPQEWSGALSPEQFYRNYLLAKDVPIYLDDFSEYPVDFAAKAAGAMCGPFRLFANTARITVDSGGQKWINAGALANTDMAAQWAEPAGYGMWEFDVVKTSAGTQVFFMPILSTNGAYTAATQNAYMFLWFVNGAVGLARITAGVIVSFFNTSALGFATNGTKYRVRIVRRVGGRWCVYIKGGVYPDFVLTASPEVDNTHTTGQFFGALLQDVNDKLSNMLYSRVCERPASFPWEFLSGTYGGVVSGSTVWANCLTAGVLYQPKDLDWQTAIFGIRKAAATTADILFVASEIGDAGVANQNGYLLRFDGATGIISLCRTTGGVVAVIAATAAAFFAVNTEYQIKVTRDWTTNGYDVFIRGGAYADWVSTGLAAVLGIYVSSNYTNWNLTANDRITAPTFAKTI